ncbi:ROK family protein [Mobiluncus mulieris]|uniref:polyphosphate--glucose phosphotransferase n=1 Tax=Mobiluncus mulieris TaxID=2052 RepID=UPI0014704C5B|nr:ROK family protein [Mobiluncus mulieris]NMW62515.1 ROK family protein [Mobiluncus mulieris]
MATSFGIDIGGSGIKGAYVDLEIGDFFGDRLKIKTPKNSTPEAVADVCREILETKEVPPQMPVGITIPGPVKNDVLGFMANLDQAWVGVDMRVLMRKHTGYTVRCVNDADAAGYAESCFGAAKDVPGLVIVTTLGTGIGTTLIYNGVLVPNCELGHLELDGHDAETRASSGVKTAEGLSFKKWAKRLQKYYSHLEMLFSPDLFVVGGGVSREHEKFLPLLDLKTPIIPAQLFNQAGIVGAAALAAGV